MDEGRVILGTIVPNIQEKKIFWGNNQCKSLSFVQELGKFEKEWVNEWLGHTKLNWAGVGQEGPWQTLTEVPPTPSQVMIRNFTSGPEGNVISLEGWSSEAS